MLRVDWIRSKRQCLLCRRRGKHSRSLFWACTPRLTWKQPTRTSRPVCRCQPVYRSYFHAAVPVRSQGIWCYAARSSGTLTNPLSRQTPSSSRCRSRFVGSRYDIVVSRSSKLNSGQRTRLALPEGMSCQITSSFTDCGLDLRSGFIWPDTQDVDFLSELGVPCPPFCVLNLCVFVCDVSETSVQSTI